MYQFYCWLICSHLQQVMDCLDAWLIFFIDQSIENTKPSSKADMKKCRPESQQSWDLINLVGRAHLLTQLKLRSLKQSEKMFIANIRLNVGPGTNRGETEWAHYYDCQLSTINRFEITENTDMIAAYLAHNMFAC